MQVPQYVDLSRFVNKADLYRRANPDPRLNDIAITVYQDAQALMDQYPEAQECIQKIQDNLEQLLNMTPQQRGEWIQKAHQEAKELEANFMDQIKKTEGFYLPLDRAYRFRPWWKSWRNYPNPYLWYYYRPYYW